VNGRPTRLDHDWFPGVVPANVHAAEGVYLDTSYSFALLGSRRDPCVELGGASGVYDRSAFVLGPRGRVTVGPYTCLNGTYLVCHDEITIGAHVFFGWGSVVTDAWPGRGLPLAARRAALRSAAADPARLFPAAGPARPVRVEDNVWVGFGAVILPGVTLGTGCVVGCKVTVPEDVPPYAVVVGDPPRVVRYLQPPGPAATPAEPS
jgi:acetyltransferase-like isoleucine patch superfamily enzyme